MNSSESKKHSTRFQLSLIVLWGLCLVSAFAVVFSTYESRQSVQSLETLRRESIGLKVITGKYELEKSSLGAYPRIETIASGKLKMSAPEATQTVLVIRE